MTRFLMFRPNFHLTPHLFRQDRSPISSLTCGIDHSKIASRHFLHRQSTTMLTYKGPWGRIATLHRKYRTNTRAFRAANIQEQNYCWRAFGQRTLNDGKSNFSSLRISRESRRKHFDCSTIEGPRAIMGEPFVRRMSTTKASGSLSEKDARLRLTALRLYRILQRACKRFVPTSEGQIFLQNDIRASDWGHYHFHDNPDDGDGVTEDPTEELIRLFLMLSGADPVSGISKENDWYDELKTLIPNVADKNTSSKTCWTTPSDLREAIRFAFHSSSSISSQSPLELQTMAVRAVQMMEDQLNLWKQTSSSTSSNGLVRITATSRCLGTVSPVAMHAAYSSTTPKYRFAYRIRVENISPSTTVQLLGRYWHISEEHDNPENDESSNEPIEVDAPYTGAVGQLPVLQPGEVFEYVSGTDLTTPKGVMMGHMYMATVPPQTRSAKSGDTVTAVTYHGSKGSSDGTKPEDEKSSQTTLFHAPVKPFRLESFEK